MKRWISVILSVVMLCTMCLFSVAVASAEETVWESSADTEFSGGGDGSAATSFSGGGTGTAESPYKIGTAAELKLFANIVNGTGLPEGFTQNAGACGILTADIVLNTGDLSGYDGTDTNSWVEWAPIGTISEMYAGTFDGDSHSVSGVYINGAATYAGLFGRLGESGTIKKLGVIKSYIKGYTYVGGVCGSSNGDITSCYNTGTVSCIITGEGNVGGVCGASWSSANIASCYNTGMVSGTEFIGGVCGLVCNITTCYNTGTVTGNRDYVGGVCGFGMDVMTNCYNSGKITGNDCVGGVSGYVVSTQTNCYTLKNTVTFTASPNQSNDGSASKTESEMKARAFVNELNNGETYFPGNYPQLTWQMTNSYIVTIPAEVTLGGSATISAEVSYIPKGSSLNITLSEKNDLSNGKTGTLIYDIMDSLFNVIEVGGSVLTVNPSTAATSNAKLYFSNPTNTIRFSGDYSGTVTFTVSVVTD